MQEPSATLDPRCSWATSIFMIRLIYPVRTLHQISVRRRFGVSFIIIHDVCCNNKTVYIEYIISDTLASANKTQHSGPETKKKKKTKWNDKKCGKKNKLCHGAVRDYTWD